MKDCEQCGYEECECCTHEGYVTRGECSKCGESGLWSDNEIYEKESP